ncbi:hypothetical protein GGR26_003236 [Lewinella marina]|uniref:Uncharacterized protein n=1 Tax=Neolewinella marina TaxID=438751 RepID=A0A2G0CE49_9BACT|nr:hypothetical protein [Neolewinella marina]NJB87456.1 hypothetical protein [Neolewinella marina]PHK98235.1 hypothetical protein CGL56_11060 [Neolewinella marina]
MSIAKKELLIELIQSLDSSEKRFFSRQARAEGEGEDDKFYRLFRFLSEGGSLDDPELPTRLGISGPGQLANLQRHLYGRLLDALRLQHRRRDLGIQVREQIDYANLLYDRGLYLHALKLLARAKEQAIRFHLDLHHLLIVDFEKVIESRHITRATAERMTSLTSESRRRQEIMGSTVRQSNLQLMLQRHFIQHGHVGSPAEARKFYQLFHHYFSDPVPPGATFQERILGHQCRFWYHYNQLQLAEAAHHARAWTLQFAGRQELRERDVNYYIKGLDRCLLVAFFRYDAPEHARLLEELVAFEQQSRHTRQQRNSQMMAALVRLRAEINQHLLTDPGTCAPATVAAFARRIAELSGVDRHKQLVMYYKLAVISVVNHRLAEALDYLSPVLAEGRPLRYDLMVYARLLQLVCHYRLGHLEFVGYGVNNLARYLGRISYRSEYPTLVIQLLRGLMREEVDAPAAFERGLAPLRERIFNLREFRYFDAAGLLAM